MLAAKRGLSAPFAYLGAQSSIGLLLKFAVCWGLHEIPIDGAGTAHLVCYPFAMAQALEGRKVNYPKGNGLAAANNQPAKTFAQDTNDLNYPTGQRISKAESTLLARLALAGHVVHKGRCDDYTVCKYGYAQYCQDIEALSAFTCQLGVK